MNRDDYFNSIEEHLAILAIRVENRAKSNLLNFNIHLENFYVYFLNLLEGWELKNLNITQENAPAIDLIDSKNQIVIQVSSEMTKSKVESALSSKHLASYTGYSFKFISISKNVHSLRNKEFKNLHGLKFSPQDDIYDTPFLLKKIKSLDIDKLKDIYQLVEKELRPLDTYEPEKTDTLLADIINIIANENLDIEYPDPQTIEYDIEDKIQYNKLVGFAKELIKDYVIYYSRIDDIYSELEKKGKNNRLFVLRTIRNIYHEHRSLLAADALFQKIWDDVVNKVKNSSNYKTLPQEGLEYCVCVLIVDAFIRCQIFEKPINHVTTR